MGILGALLRLLQSRRDAVLRSSWGRDVGAGFFKTADKASGSLVTLTSPADFAGAFVLASARGAGALLMLSSPLFGSSVQTVAELALRPEPAGHDPVSGFCPGWRIDGCSTCIASQAS
jgi:hypothetical protein